MIHFFIHEDSLLEPYLLDFLELFDRNSSEYKIWIQNNHTLDDIEDQLLIQKIDDIDKWDNEKSYQGKNAKYWIISNENPENPLLLLPNESSISEVFERKIHAYFKDETFYLVTLEKDKFINTKDFILKIDFTYNQQTEPILNNVDYILFKDVSDLLSKIVESGHRNLLPSICSTGKIIWDNKEILFKNLDFCDRLENDLKQIRDRHKIKEVFSSLELLENYCSALWKPKTPFDKNLINSDISKESLSNSQKKSKLYSIKCPDGDVREFTWHDKLKPTPSMRLFFYPQEDIHRIIIGSILLKKLIG